MGILLLLLVVSPSRAAQMFFAPALNFSVCVSFKSGMTQWHHLAVRGSGVPSDRIMPWLPKRIQCGQYPFRPGVGAYTCTSGWLAVYAKWADVQHVRVVREPFERLISGYTDRCVNRRLCCRFLRSGRSNCSASSLTNTTAGLAHWVSQLKEAQRFRVDDRGRSDGCISDDDHFRSQQCDCHAAAVHGFAFDKTIAWTSSNGGTSPGSLHVQVLALCMQLAGSAGVARGERLVGLCSELFPPESNASHRTGAGVAEVIGEVAGSHASGAHDLASKARASPILLGEIMSLYENDFAAYESMRATAAARTAAASRARGPTR